MRNKKKKEREEGNISGEDGRLIGFGNLSEVPQVDGRD